MRNYLVIFNTFLILTLITSLFGCDNSRNTEIICKNNPEICSDLHKDSWCRFERGHLIRHRLVLKDSENHTPRQLYKQLGYLEDYSRCIELAAGVEHIIHTERTNDRLRAYGISTQNLQQLQQHTKNSKSPLLAYYHWSRLHDKEALNVLLTAEKNHQIEDPELLGYIAAYYLRREGTRSRDLYLQAISIADQTNFNPDWLLGLAEFYRFDQDLERTYMLSKANVLFSGKPFSEPQMMALIKGDEQLAKFLNDKAEEMVTVIQANEFANSQIKQYLAQ